MKYDSYFLNIAVTLKVKTEAMRCAHNERMKIYLPVSPSPRPPVYFLDRFNGPNDYVPIISPLLSAFYLTSMNQPYRTAVFALGTIALLSLSNCAVNGATTKVSAPLGNSSKTLTQNPGTTVDTSTAFPKTSITYKTNHFLSNQQKAQLAQLGIPIAVPTYLPAGFRLTQFSAQKEEDEASGAWYSMFYQGANNTCLELSVNVDPAMSLERLQKTLVKTRLGEVKVYSGNVEGKPMTVGLFSLPKNNGYMLRTGAWMPTTNPGRRCNPVSRNEYIQVLRSLEMLK